MTWFTSINYPGAMVKHDHSLVWIVRHHWPVLTVTCTRVARSSVCPGDPLPFTEWRRIAKSTLAALLGACSASCNEKTRGYSWDVSLSNLMDSLSLGRSCLICLQKSKSASNNNCGGFGNDTQLATCQQKWAVVKTQRYPFDLFFWPDFCFAGACFW